MADRIMESRPLEAAFENAREYELLTQAVYQAILTKEGADNLLVEHNVNQTGRSGVAHQCDVFWKFRHAGLEHAVVVECKCYKKAVDLGDVRSFSALLSDLGNTSGVMVTTVGFQAGARRFAEYHGITLKLLRSPREEDWKDRVTGFVTDVVLIWFDAAKGISARTMLAVSVEEQAVIQDARARGAFAMEEGAKARLYDANGNPATSEFGFWLVENSTLVSRAEGGPYQDQIPAPGLFARISVDGTEKLCPVAYVELTYYAKELARQTISSDARQLVAAVLQDFASGKPEFFHRRA